MIGFDRGRSVREDERVLREPATSDAVRAAHQQWSSAGIQPYLYRTDAQEVRVRLSAPPRSTCVPSAWSPVPDGGHTWRVPRAALPVVAPGHPGLPALVAVGFRTGRERAPVLLDLSRSPGPIGVIGDPRRRHALLCCLAAQLVAGGGSGAAGTLIVAGADPRGASTATLGAVLDQMESGPSSGIRVLLWSPVSARPTPAESHELARLWALSARRPHLVVLAAAEPPHGGWLLRVDADGRLHSPLLEGPCRAGSVPAVVASTLRSSPTGLPWTGPGAGRPSAPLPPRIGLATVLAGTAPADRVPGVAVLGVHGTGDDPIAVRLGTGEPFLVVGGPGSGRTGLLAGLAVSLLATGTTVLVAATPGSPLDRLTRHPGARRAGAPDRGLPSRVRTLLPVAGAAVLLVDDLDVRDPVDRASRRDLAVLAAEGLGVVLAARPDTIDDSEPIQPGILLPPYLDPIGRLLGLDPAVMAAAPREPGVGLVRAPLGDHTLVVRIPTARLR